MGSLFKTRKEAGELLAQELAAFRDDPRAILLALPRGGVVVGYQLSLALHLPLDVLVTRKIGAPGNPEYALGAVSETGAVYWSREALLGLSLSEQDLESAVRAQEKEVARRVTLYRQGRAFPDLTGRTVILRRRWPGNRRNILCLGGSRSPGKPPSRRRSLSGRPAIERAGGSAPRRPIDRIVGAGTILCRRKFLPRTSSRPKIGKYCSISN